MTGRDRAGMHVSINRLEAPGVADDDKRCKDMTPEEQAALIRQI